MRVDERARSQCIPVLHCIARSTQADQSATSLGRVVQARARLQSAGLQVCTVVERVGAGPQLAPNGELFSVVSCFSGMSHASGASALSLSPATTKMGLELSTSGIAVCTATAFTNPIDVVKIRIQLASSSQGAGSLGVFSTGAAVIRNEGIPALWKGVSPAMARGLIYGGLRLGLYTPIKSAMGTSKHNDVWTFYKKVAAGMTSGGLAAAITNPTELVKTRLQAQGCAHATPTAVIRDIVSSSGVAGLWRGTMPSAARAALLTASQCATYDVIKCQIMHMTDSADRESLATQVAAGAVTGMVTTTVTSPADVLKTRMYAEAPGGGPRLGMSGTVAALLREEGAGVLFRGWVANYARLGPQTLITFLAAEQLRKLFGLDAS